jgi:hypothetical protein
VLALAACASEPPLRFLDIDGDAHDPIGPGAHASVLIFTTFDCPIANSYSPEINAIVDDYSGKPIDFYLVHTDRGATRDLATQHAADYGYQLPVLLDNDRKLVERTGVTITPEVAVFEKSGELAYRGRIDNWYADLGKKRPRPTVRDLRAALDALLAGKQVPTPRTEAVGCTIE